MWFLIKGAFWFSLVLVALSWFGEPAGDGDGSAPELQLTGAVSAAGEAIRYVGAICTEKPDVCEKGVETFHVLGQRAREGAKVAYELLDTQFASDKSTGKPAADVTHTVSVTAAGTGADEITTGTIVPLPMKRPRR